MRPKSKDTLGRDISSQGGPERRNREHREYHRGPTAGGENPGAANFAVYLLLQVCGAAGSESEGVPGGGGA